MADNSLGVPSHSLSFVQQVRDSYQSFNRSGEENVPSTIVRLHIPAPKIHNRTIPLLVSRSQAVENLRKGRSSARCSPHSTILVDGHVPTCLVHVAITMLCTYHTYRGLSDTTMESLRYQGILGKARNHTTTKMPSRRWSLATHTYNFTVVA